MANPIFKALGGNAPQGGPMNFVQFMMQNRGNNPNKMLNDLVASGQVNQQMLDQAQQKAKQMEGQFAGFKSMFGF